MVQLINVNYQTGVPAQIVSDPTVPGIVAAQFDSDPSAPGVIQVALVSDPAVSPTKYILADTAAPALGFPDVQLLGSLIGSGLLDTGTADATNLLVSTQQAFSGLDWQTGGEATLSDNSSTDPLSGSTASILTEAAGNTVHYAETGFQTATVTEVSFSIYLKQGLRTRAALYIYDALVTTTLVTATFDLAGGAIGIAAAVAGTFTTPLATITAESNGFYLCTVSANLVGGSGSYFAIVHADAGSGSGGADQTYAGNTSGAALTLWGAKVNTGAPSAYVPLNSNAGAVGTTVQQAFSPNGGATAYWGTQTNNSWIGYDFGTPVALTRVRIAPRPSSATIQVYPTAPDYALSIAGALIQTDVADATFASPTTAYTFPAAGSLPYYPRYWLSEIALSVAPAARYARILPPAVSFGGVSALQFFAKAGTTANACPVQPVITPNGGRFPSLSRVVAMESTQGATIYYTTDGSTPTTSSTKYTAPFTLSIGSGATVTVKAIANMPSLSTPNSLVTTSAPFYGYGYKPNDNWYDTSGILIEAHSGSVDWDPNTNAYYWIGQLQNINSVARPGHVGEPNGWPGTFLYKGVSLDPKDPDGLLNWQNMGCILPQITPAAFIGGRYHWKYNALNNNYVVWLQPQINNGTSTLYYASTSGSDITKNWSWNLTPIVANNFYDYDLFTDSDGVSVYAFWRNAINVDMRIQQLNSSYTGFTGSSISIPYTSGSREGCVLFKYPFVDGGTYFAITSENDPYDSTQEMDLRYITGTGGAGTTPLTASWSALNGTYAWATDPIGGNYNGQGTHAFIPRGSVQPFVMLDYWHGGDGVPNYNSRYVWLPIVVTGQTMVIQQPTSWDPSQLATAYTLQALTLSASTFTVGNAQGTVIGTVNSTTIGSTLSLADSHSGAVQLVAGVIQVGPTPPGTSGSFNISITETLATASNSPKTTVLSIIENAVGGSLSGSVATFSTSQNINLTSLAASGLSDWAAFGYTANAASIARKNGGGSKISALTNVGSGTLANFNNSSSVTWLSTWTDGTAPNGTASNEGYIVFVAEPSGNGMSFTVPADTTTRTLLVYVALSFSGGNTTQGKLTATLSDASAGPYVDTSVTIVSGSANLLGKYTITYAAASTSQFLTITWINNTSLGSQNVQISAAVIE